METKLSNLVPLNGSNYNTWKIQCKMALIKDGLWNIVNETEIVPDKQSEPASYVKYLSRKDRALATIVLSVETSLLYLIGDPDDPAVVWKKLAEQFQKKTWANKLALRRKLYSLKLKDGDSVHQHIKTMMEIFDELSVIGDSIDEEDRVVHLLATLPDSYNMLVTALEASQDVPKWVLVTERLLHEESKIKEREINSSELKAMASKHHVNKRGPKCFHCGKHGHVKRDCRLLETKNDKSNPPRKKVLFTRKIQDNSSDSGEGECIGLFTHQALLSNGKRSDWIVDSGATCHMCFDIEKFSNFRKFDVAEDITLGDGFSVEAIGTGTIELKVSVPDGKHQKCRLYETLYVPKLSYNLLSVSKATKSGKTCIFSDSNCQILDNKQKVVATGSKIGNLYYLNCCEVNESTHAANSCLDGNSKEEIWHRRFGHLGEKNLQKLVKNQIVTGLDYNINKEIKFCEPCLDGKHHRTSFPKSRGKRATQLLEIVHSDVCGRIEAKSLGGAEYFVTFIDDKSRFVWIYVLKHKREVPQKFSEWKTMVEKFTGKNIKTLRTDNGGEYTSKEFEDYLKKEGIKHEYTVPKTPEQNGVAERMNRTLVEMVRSMLSDSKLPKKFWAEALSTASYIRNRSPTNAVEGMTPYEVLKGRKPNVKHLRIFGCDAFVHVPKDERFKMDSKAKKSIFLGYGVGIKGYRLFDTKKSRVFHSRDVIFNESGSMAEQKKKEIVNPFPVVIEHQDSSDDEDKPQELTGPRRSSRLKKTPDLYGEWVYMAHNLNDPLTMKEALSGPEKNEWLKAMENEISSLHSNAVWDLTELPSGRKAIGSKWVFKRKYDADGNMEHYKARLVAQGFLQKQGIDYDETFCPVVRFESVRTVIALAAQHDLKLHQLDIATAFLNGNLHEAA
ncbi:hypothetical protein Ahia01_000357100 [Argonauta hians]